MTLAGRVLAIAAFTFASIATASDQAPLIEKNVSMRMALAIIDATIEQCTKDGYKVRKDEVCANAGIAKVAEQLK